MNHKPYETWLLSEDRLNKDQEAELEAHLAQCDPCRSMATAWDRVHENLVTTSPPSPTPGFTQRWHARLAIHQQQRQQRNMVLLTFGLFAAASLIFLSLALGSILNTSFPFAFSQFIAKLSLFASRISQWVRFFRGITTASPLVFPIVILFGFGAFIALTALILTWLSVINRLHQPIQQGVRTS